MATGGLPDGLSYDEQIALRLTKELSTSHRIDESLYRAAENTLRGKGIDRYRLPHRHLPLGVRDAHYVRDSCSRIGRHDICFSTRPTGNAGS